MKNLFLKSLAILLLSSQAHAGILGSSVFIEPSLSYKVENTKLTDLALTTTEIKTTAPAFGLKLNYRSPSGLEISLGGEYVKGSANISNLANKNEFSKSTAGLTIGVNSAGFVKMYLGASIHNEFVIAQSDQIQETKFSGPSYLAGLVFRLLPSFNLGFQYNLNQYNKVKGNTYLIGENIESYYSKVDTQDYSIFISTTF
jgi:opacity protein-like surface antigen